MHYNTSVVSARRTGGAWLVTAADGRVWRASALVMCTGQEGTPHVPSLRGAEAFAGELLHSARYAPNPNPNPGPNPNQALGRVLR